MPYRIIGPVKTEVIGKCPWCDKKKAILHLDATLLDGEPVCEYLCAECLLTLDRMRKKRGVLAENGASIEINV